jgi:hypothetical protein
MHRIDPKDAQFYNHLPTNDPTTTARAIAFTLTDVGDGWEQVDYYGESIFDPSGGIRVPEWVYILVNKGVPGVCKIGMTTTSVEQRTREINGATGVITPWFPVYRFKCVNSRYLERDVHAYLETAGYRVNPSREGFAIDSKTAIEVIERLGANYQTYSLSNE